MFSKSKTTFAWGLGIAAALAGLGLSARPAIAAPVHAGSQIVRPFYEHHPPQNPPNFWHEGNDRNDHGRDRDDRLRRYREEQWRERQAQLRRWHDDQHSDYGRQSFHGNDPRRHWDNPRWDHDRHDDDHDRNDSHHNRDHDH